MEQIKSVVIIGEDRFCVICNKTLKKTQKNCCSKECYYKHKLGMKNPKLSKLLMGHIPWNKGLTKETDERVLKCSQSLIGTHNGKGKLRSEETKKKMRKPKSEEHRKNMCIAQRGKIVSKETRQKISNTLKGRIPSLNNRIATTKANRGRKHTKEAKEKIRTARLKQVLPTKDTSIEIKLQEELKNQNIVFTTHPRIYGQPDIFIEPNICIFADGCYWHNCPTHFLTNGFNKRENKDTKITKELEKEGYIVYRFWEHEIDTSVNKCIDKIGGEMNGRTY